VYAATRGNWVEAGQWAQAGPGRGRTLTYQALHDLCDRVAGGLRELGVRPGDRVSLYSPNRWEWVVAYHAALRAGAVVNPINVMLTPEEVAFVLNDCGAAAIFTAGEKAM
jgi:long-chain acyl-CoA synthetase